MWQRKSIHSSKVTRWPIKIAYLLTYVAVALWLGALVCEVLTGW